LSWSVLRWPDREQVDHAAKDWIRREAKRHPELVRAGYFGSYARGDHGVGSDLDLVAIVSTASAPFAERSLAWDLLGLPVPAEIVIYTTEELDRLVAEGGRFARTLMVEAVWIYP
jgi:predicted nucleotidyltransferase